MTRTKAASLADELVDRFERDILAGMLAAGTRLPTEKATTERFGVSRTVVREAFARLAARGLIEARQGSGVYVAENARYQAFQVAADDVRDADEVLRLIEMRVALETEMADLAARRRTEADLRAISASLTAMEASTDVDASIAADLAFHAAIAGATQNPHFQRFTEFLGIRLVPSRRSYMQSDDPVAHSALARTINRDHRAIYAAIAAGDGVRARRAARRHMENSAERHRAGQRTARPD